MEKTSQDPRLLRRLLRAKDRIDAAAHAGFRDPSGNGGKMIEAAQGKS